MFPYPISQTLYDDVTTCTLYYVSTKPSFLSTSSSPKLKTNHQSHHQRPNSQINIIPSSQHSHSHGQTRCNLQDFTSGSHASQSSTAWSTLTSKTRRTTTAIQARGTRLKAGNTRTMTCKARRYYRGLNVCENDIRATSAATDGYGDGDTILDEG